MDRVVSGQKIDIKADTWNRIVGLTEAHAGPLGNAGDATPARGRHLLVVNRGETTMPRYSAVEIGAADNAAESADEPVLLATAPTGDDAPFAVLLEPAPKDKVVRAAISGVARAKAAGTPGSFGGPSADGVITEGGSGAARILVPGNPGVVLLNAGAGRSYRPFEAWVNYQPALGGWTLWMNDGPVFFWGRLNLDELGPVRSVTGIVSSNGYALRPVESAAGDWTRSGGLWRTGLSRGTWCLALEFAYGEDGRAKPVSWTPAVITEEEVEEAQALGRLRYLPLAKFSLSGTEASASVEFTQYKSGMAVVMDTPPPTLPDPEYAESNPILVGILGTAAADTPTQDGWTYEQPGANGLRTTYPHTGVAFTTLSRVEYNASGDKILYGYFRTLHFAPDGRLVSISGETQTTIDTPVEVSLNG